MLSFSIAPPSEQLLDACIQDIASGDRDALARLYTATHAAVYGFALSILRNAPDAEDVLQEVYIRLYGAAGQYRSQGKPMAWLLTIAKHLAFQHLRQQRTTTPLTELHDSALAVTDEDRLVLESLLGLLGDEERQIVMLHSTAGLKHREIAALLDLPLPTVLSKYSRAIKKLRQILKEAE